MLGDVDGGWGWRLGGTMELGMDDQGLGGKLDGRIGGFEGFGGDFLGWRGGGVLDWGGGGIWGKGDPGNRRSREKNRIGVSERWMGWKDGGRAIGILSDPSLFAANAGR
jgi:hypothetical protein